MAPLVCSPVVIPFSPFSSPSPFSLSSPLQSSSRDEYRVLEAEAAVTGGNRASVKLWVYHGEKLVAKVNNVRGTPNSSAWNRKFVFAVTDDFLRDEDASLFIDIYSGPNILGGLVGKKKFVATAKCCFKDVLPGILFEEEENATCCTVPISNGIAGDDDASSSSALNLNLKLRLWKEVLHYVAP